MYAFTHGMSCICLRIGWVTVDDASQPELKEMEGKILGAEERGVKLEYELFQRVREAVLGRLGEIRGTAAALAQLDVLGSFAETARLYNYCRPKIGDEGVLFLREGRHPVLEQNLSDERFVPNDTQINRETQIGLITGPNMAGKSTYIRQVASSPCWPIPVRSFRQPKPK